jgi:hypothetical protein
MIGTMREPMSGSRSRLRSSRANAVVVLACTLSPVPANTSANGPAFAGACSRTGAANIFFFTTRSGTDPPSARRLAIMYSNSGESVPGCQNGGSPSATSESGIGSCRRSRNAVSSADVSFLIWCVALRDSMPAPSVHPLTVLARITVGLPSCSTAIL